jgi:prepilin-type N-terminal cleavage/methylation domain-containing protein
MLKINIKLSNKGFSLNELMVAVAILAMAIFGIFQAYSVGFMGMVDARNVTVASNYARERMEEIKNKSFGDITVTDDPPADIPGTKFKRKVTVANEIEDELKKVTTVISWDDRNGIYKEVKLETLIYNID